MKLIDWLRKLGILRFGAEAGVYRNAKDRPMSLQADGVVNLDRKAKPDLPSAADKPIR